MAQCIRCTESRLGNMAHIRCNEFRVLAFIGPNGCSTRLRRSRMARGLRSIRVWRASIHRFMLPASEAPLDARRALGLQEQPVQLPDPPPWSESEIEAFEAYWPIGCR